MDQADTAAAVPDRRDAGRTADRGAGPDGGISAPGRVRPSRVRPCRTNAIASAGPRSATRAASMRR
ncbi:hypothetical protein [Streptomyces sp. MI02-7b]|uniref:hypothetical protein n=1 Tax=Streptomyces sp. MI02-7b TaxID=462941 RepID=UPI0029A983AE|nr:hypothetical protein [Streptomyces sp. MI02-7b]MDX3074228.1 hypothetical protein [Streptomyces sp. MI02-7b]